MEQDDRSLDIGCGELGRIPTLGTFQCNTFSVGECVLSHTNHHVIGVEPRLKEGAETEVARLQFQMGK